MSGFEPLSRIYLVMVSSIMPHEFNHLTIYSIDNSIVCETKSWHWYAHCLVYLCVQMFQMYIGMKVMCWSNTLYKSTNNVKIYIAWKYQYKPYTQLRPVGLEILWHFCPWMRARVNCKQITLLPASTDKSATQPLGQRDAIGCTFKTVWQTNS